MGEGVVLSGLLRNTQFHPQQNVAPVYYSTKVFVITILVHSTFWRFVRTLENIVGSKTV